MIKYIITLVLLVCIITSCSDSNKIVDPPLELSYNFSDYIHFDTINSYIMSQAQDSTNAKPEIFLYWEAIIGEPFTDLNGNGVYDVGIDIFIKSIGADNMDLNHDGVYSGPNSPWTLGVPYDDINGDGLYNYSTGMMSPNYYTIGRPYYDFNNNGIWDSNPFYDIVVINCTTSTDNSSILYSYGVADSSFSYISDSNLSYSINSSIYSSSTVFNFDFEVADSNYLSFSLYNYNRTTTVLRFNNILDLENITSDTSHIFGYYQSQLPDSFFKEIILNTEIAYKDTLYTGLLQIRLSNYSGVFIGSEKRYPFMGFYFSRDLGLIAIRNYSEGGGVKYFIDKVEVTPQVLSK